jgi:hypothetical protein
MTATGMASSPTLLRRCVWGVFAASAVGMAVGMVLELALVESSPGAVLFTAAFFSCSLAGLLIGVREPGNRVAWLLLGIGALIAVGSVAEPYTEYGLRIAPGALPAANVVAAVTGALWVPTIGICGTFLILLFPDGRLPTPRWRPVARTSGLTIGVLSLVFVFAPGEVEAGDGIPNPLAIAALAPLLDVVLVLLPVLPLCMLACAIGLVMRFRRSSGIERVQLKWLASAGAVVATCYLTMMLVSYYYDAVHGGTTPPWLELVQNAAVLTFVLLPLSIAVAVSRHGLYGIDRLLSRTVSYALVTGTLLVLYLGLVTAVSRLTPRGSSWAVAASTLSVAAAFQPLRRRVQARVDRRFNRARYDMERTVDRFQARLRDEVDLEAVRRDLLEVVRATLEPAAAGVWLRSPAERRR